MSNSPPTTRGSLAKSSGSNDDTLFKNVRFWFSQKVPLRSSFIEDVRARGGVIVSLDKSADIMIADQARKDAPSGSYSYKWIEECIKQNFLVDKDQYRSDSVKKVARPAGSSQSAKITRNPFTYQDDVDLYQHVQNSLKEPDNINRGHSARGNQIYKQLQELNGRHPWQSWRDRYIKYLEHNPPKLPPTSSTDDFEATPIPIGHQDQTVQAKTYDTMATLNIQNDSVIRDTSTAQTTAVVPDSSGDKTVHGKEGSPRIESISKLEAVPTEQAPSPGKAPLNGHERTHENLGREDVPSPAMADTKTSNSLESVPADSKTENVENDNGSRVSAQDNVTDNRSDVPGRIQVTLADMSIAKSHTIPPERRGSSRQSSPRDSPIPSSRATLVENIGAQKTASEQFAGVFINSLDRPRTALDRLQSEESVQHSWLPEAGVRSHRNETRSLSDLDILLIAAKEGSSFKKPFLTKTRDIREPLQDIAQNPSTQDQNSNHTFHRHDEGGQEQLLTAHQANSDKEATINIEQFLDGSKDQGHASSTHSLPTQNFKRHPQTSKPSNSDFTTPVMRTVDGRRTTASGTYSRSFSSPLGFQQGQILSAKDGFTPSIIYSTPFSEEDSDHLFNVAQTIQTISVDRYASAWEDFARENPEHSAFEWRHYYENEVLPRFKAVQLIPSKPSSKRASLAAGGRPSLNVADSLGFAGLSTVQILNEPLITSLSVAPGSLPDLDHPLDISSFNETVTRNLQRSLSAQPELGNNGSPNVSRVLNYTSSGNEHDVPTEQRNVGHQTLKRKGPETSKETHNIQAEKRRKKQLRADLWPPRSSRNDSASHQSLPRTSHSREKNVESASNAHEKESRSTKIISPEIMATTGRSDRRVTEEDEKENLVRNQSGFLVFTSPERRFQNDEALRAFTDPPKEFRLVPQGEGVALGLDETLLRVHEDTIQAINSQGNRKSPEPVHELGIYGQPATPRSNHKSSRFYGDIQDIMEASTPVPDLVVPPPDFGDDEERSAHHLLHSSSVEGQLPAQPNAIGSESGSQRRNIAIGVEQGPEMQVNGGKDVSLILGHDSNSNPQDMNTSYAVNKSDEQRLTNERAESLQILQDSNYSNLSLASRLNSAEHLIRAPMSVDSVTQKQRQELFEDSASPSRNSSSVLTHEGRTEVQRSSLASGTNRSMSRVNGHSGLSLEIRKFFADQMKKGYTKGDIAWALQRSSMELDLATMVLICWRNWGKLPELPGIWSISEDEKLMLGTKGDRRELDKRHSKRKVHERIQFLRGRPRQDGTIYDVPSNDDSDSSSSAFD